jgi:NTP pyrophosphatase (non-canonical NTP hydrolase)
MIDYMNLERALDAVRIERFRQERLKAEGRFKHTLDEASLTEAEKHACIAEELGEVARNVLARAGRVTDGDRTSEALHKELVQVAALSVAWLESLKL